MTAINMDLSLIRKNLLNRIYMNPEYGFKIQKRDFTTSEWYDLLWLDMIGEIWAKSLHIINTETELDDNGLVVDNGKIKIINNNKYDAFYADENGEMRLDGRLRVVRHLNTWTPTDKWDLEPESNRIVLLDAYKDDTKGGKLLINDWDGNLNAFLGSAPSSDYSGGFFKLYNGVKDNSKERIELGVLSVADTGIIRIKNKDSKAIVELKGDSNNRGEISIKNPLNNNAIISVGGNNLGGFLGIYGNDIESINAILGVVEDSSYDLVGGYLELYNNSITDLKVRIGSRRSENAGSMELYGHDNKMNLYMSAIDNDNNSISSGVFKIFDSKNIPTLLMYAETPLNISGREGSVDSAFIIGQDKEHAKIGMYGGGNNTGALLELASGGVNSHGNFPNLSLGDLSSNGSYLGGGMVIYENMTANTHEERILKRRIQLGVFNDGLGGTRGELQFYNNSGQLVGRISGGTIEDHIIVTGAFRGSSTFNSINGRFIPFNVGNTNYTPVITPSANPNGYLGEIWIIKATNGFTVYNSGTATTSFDYTVIR